jgi:hypothetical protein
MAVDTLMLEWGWSRDVARAVFHRQGQLQDMRDSGVSLAEYSRLAERKLSGHKHAMSSKSFGSGNHSSKKRATSGTTSTSPGDSKTPHPCALQMPPSIQFVF